MLWLLLKSKDCLDFQKAKSKWLKEGDANSSYFQACVKGRNSKNSFVALKKGDVWLENPASVKEEISNHFAELFADDGWNRPT
ncbi:RNA-directed DNA polymerase (Reverse transcriptase), partial [Trifolium medium]|nr:RNA-directed DNA polymerase (Reverse transcriptase) [Trifolium medium]